MSMEGSNVNSNKGDAYQDKDLTIRISNHGQSIQSFIVLGGRYDIYIYIQNFGTVHFLFSDLFIFWNCSFSFF